MIPGIPPSSRTQEAIDTPFDNATNGFIAEDVQTAIEEVKAAIVDIPVDFNSILVDNFADVLVDNEFNVITGL
jgi:hypothetical protein